MEIVLFYFNFGVWCGGGGELLNCHNWLIKAYASIQFNDRIVFVYFF